MEAFMPESSVLVLDDEAGIIRLCQRLLSRAGFQVFAFTQPREGLALLEQERIDLLLVDIRMPGMDGFQVIDQARRRQPDLAVVIMTGFGTVEMAIQALQRGADGLILKPFDGAELVQSVKHALQENQNKRDISRLQALRPLFNITETLFAETDPERLQDLLLDAVCGQLHCPQAAIYHREMGEDRLRLVAGRGESLEKEEDYSNGGIIGRADVLGTPLWVNREGPGDPDLQGALGELGFGSVMCVPLPLKDGSNVFWAARAIDQPAFRASDLEMFVILARQATVALENARLHAELHAYIRQVEESQRALIQAEKMATVGRLTASIAHEINNPLQAVQNCLHLTDRRELAAPDRQKYLALAQSELERLMHTVQRMLEFYRPGAVDRKPIDVNDVVNRLLVLVESQLKDHRIRVKTKLAPRLPKVLVVKDQIQQVFLNLTLNAMEAMPDGGELYISTLATKRAVDVTFEDNGPGIPEEDRERVFEPFVSTKTSGTGLGLAVSYGIIAAHGGSLELVPGQERGACFRVTLPIQES
jgi:signal transduction histidine kinase/FixJ family two-component response regulator